MKDLNQLLVSAFDAKGAVAFDLLVGGAAVDQPVNADIVGIGGVESADISSGALLGILIAVSRKTPREKLLKGFIGMLIIHGVENFFGFTEKIAGLELSAAHAPEIAFNFCGQDVVGLQRLPDFGSQTVDEFSAKFYYGISGGVVLGEDAASDAVAGLENPDRQSGVSQINGRGEAGGSGSDDEHVGHLFISPQRRRGSYFHHRGTEAHGRS